MKQGPVSIPQYLEQLGTNRTSPMRAFAEEFLEMHRTSLAPFSKKWVANPFNQWSRQWEYPFCHEAINKYAATQEHPIRVLDAGSGITFFPFYLSESDPVNHITCCDLDPALATSFSTITENGNRKVGFINRNLADTGLQDHSIDAIYCISVLEHISAREDILQEFHRLLRPGGLLAITFDISLDGLGDISPEELPLMIKALRKLFAPDDSGSLEALENGKHLLERDIVSTQYIANRHPALLPWRYPLLSSIKSALLKRRIPSSRIKQLTFSSHTFRAKP
ncbi:MAG: class I SAM-dependent methyltransferase [Acidobacteria bacterium]|uniref:Class I SAM-dependent methyltransferase n=1 Tax=Candidatus Polarisedimenticola svalbardensis TaxID=2886004 RepID=A0A8J6XU50_9BACT|nr:class I SAM-dependent methyltransferase [Candidatus Polarisedimenticola svalbardensis]